MNLALLLVLVLQDEVAKLRRQLPWIKVEQDYVFAGPDGTLSGLPLLRYTTEARLDEIVALHEANGCDVFNPHRYTLEEGGMKRTDQKQLDFKRQADPTGRLNPGKMIAWENPDFDFKAGKAWLFNGLNPVGPA